MKKLPDLTPAERLEQLRQRCHINDDGCWIWKGDRYTSGQPREAYRPALPMSGALVAERSKAEREKLRALRQRLKDEAPAPVGLPALFAAIADAVGCAGGDEASELRRLEGMFVRPVLGGVE